VSESDDDGPGAKLNTTFKLIIDDSVKALRLCVSIYSTRHALGTSCSHRFGLQFRDIEAAKDGLRKDLQKLEVAKLRAAGA
jgi:hypothetical protein